jgi:hypothetical protein
MNTFKKNAAVKRFTEMAQNGASEVEVIEALRTDEKGYAEEEVREIMVEIEPVFDQVRDQKDREEAEKARAEEERLAAEEAAKLNAADVKPPSPPKPQETQHKPAQVYGTLIQFTQYKVRPLFDSVVIPGEGRKEFLKGYEATGEPIRTSEMEQRHADILNAQTPNSMTYYYKPGQDKFVDAKEIFA